ncbi:nucleotide-binding alpha-beta plait domain-containing protein [Tanacetum coccineum]
MENAEDGWTKVQRRGQRNKSPNADFVKVIKDKSITFFFTRFPDSIEDKSLWKLFGKYGTLTDVYLASKRTKSGTRFGFVCYINVVNPLSFEQKLNEISIDGMKMLVNIAKYEKGGQRVSNKFDGGV